MGGLKRRRWVKGRGELGMGVDLGMGETMMMMMMIEMWGWRHGGGCFRMLES